MHKCLFSDDDTANQHQKLIPSVEMLTEGAQGKLGVYLQPEKLAKLIAGNPYQLLWEDD